jgi:trigger factor
LPPGLKGASAPPRACVNAREHTGEERAGKEIQGTRSTGYQVIIGSNSLIPGFEEQLKGLKKGEKKDLALTFPDKYHAEHLQGKPVTFAVEVKNVENVHMPVMTDEFVKEKQLGDSAADLRARITESMRTQEEQMDRQRREQAFFDAIAAATKVDLAAELTEQEERNLFEELSNQLQSQKMSLEQWMQQSKRAPEALQKELREEAVKRVRLRFGIQKLIEEKKIEVTPEERSMLIPAFLATLPEEERVRAAERYREGSQGFEELVWRKRVEKLVESMLAA